MNYRILFLFIAAGFTGCQESEDANGGAPVSRAVEANYLVATPEIFRNEVITTAEILPYESVILRAPVSGTVLNIYFEEGGTVREGQLIIRLDDRSWKAQLKGLEVEYSSLEKELARYRQLLDLEGASQQQVENAVARLAALQAEIDQLRVNIQLANVKAPFAGQVGMRNFSLGSYMSQGDEITTLAQVDKLKVNFNLPERYQPDIKTGELVKVKVEEDTFPARIYAIDPLINTESRTIQARAILERNGNNVMPGVFAETILPTQVVEEAIVLPSQVVVPEIQDQTVYVMNNGRAERRVVIITARTSDKVLIAEGVNAGDTVLTTGLMQIKEGVEISLKQNISQK